MIRNIRRIAAIVMLLSSASLVFAATLMLQQTLPNPVQRPRVQAPDGCPASLLFKTNPDPLLNITGVAGIAIFGCSFSATGVNPAVRIVSAGTATSTFTVPLGISVYLLPAPVDPVPQSCAGGILLTSETPQKLAQGDYAYCVSFTDATLLRDISVSWTQ